MILGTLLFAILASQPLTTWALRESFTESLRLTPLADGKVSARFAFTTTLYGVAPRAPSAIGDHDQTQHYTSFPLPLAQLLRAQAITELHLTLNAGKWDYDTWGYPHDYSVGSGAELWVWMADGSKVSIDQRWKDLSNNLAGLFCASLGGLDETRTTRPKYAFQPQGDLLADYESHVLHAFLPSESVCTENLTPFLKLLPSKGRSGLSALLDPHRLFDSAWHGIGVHVLWKGSQGIEVNLTFNAVLDPVRLSAMGKRDWSLSSLFGRQLSRPCPVSESSLVIVDLPKDVAYSLSPQSSGILNAQAIYNVSSLSLPLNIAMTWPPEVAYQPVRTLPGSSLSVRRVLTGGSQSRGGVHVNFINRKNVSQQVVCVETAPWFINYFLSTRRIIIDGSERADIILGTSYSLPFGHRPSLLETALLLPPNSETSITTSFSKSFIAYTQHPPDAERGWDLPPAVISFSLSNNSDEHLRIYTRNLLIDLPTPDFSMPYNVIIMSSTVIALFFGSIFNLLTRKFVWVKTSPN